MNNIKFSYLALVDLYAHCIKRSAKLFCAQSPFPRTSIAGMAQEDATELFLLIRLTGHTRPLSLV
jgi:hypothetical protein